MNRNLNDGTAQERAYASSVGVTLPANSNAVFTGFNGSVGQALRPFPQYGNINNILESQGRSWYDAGTAKLERRFSNGIQFGASYTFSKLLTNASEDLLGASPTGSLIQIPGDSASLKSASPNNAAHVFVVNYPTSDFADPNFGFATVSGDPAFYAPRVIRLRVRFTY